MNTTMIYRLNPSTILTPTYHSKRLSEQVHDQATNKKYRILRMCILIEQVIKMKFIRSRRVVSYDDSKPAALIEMKSIDSMTVFSQDDSNRSSFRGVIGHIIKSCLTVKTQRDSLNNQSTSTHSHSDLDRSVRFHTVEFREYPIILCDNPSASGPPVGLGWGYDPKNTLQAQVDAYEAYRDGLRRTKSELRIPPYIREFILLEAGYSRYEIRSVVQMSEKAKERRRKENLRQHIIERYSWWYCCIPQ
jgi:hypothetical protein